MFFILVINNIPFIIKKTTNYIKIIFHFLKFIKDFYFFKILDFINVIIPKPPSNFFGFTLHLKSILE